MADYSVTWAILGIYLAVLLGILVHSQVRRCRVNRGAGAVEDHYLAGREIPAAFLALTTVASVFSGYTVTGLPAEAYKTGFGYMRWVGLNVPLLVFLLAIAPRMVWLARKRGHVSVLDVVRDRFVVGPIFPARGFDLQGSIIHWLATLTFFIPSAIYLLAQFISFTANMNVLSGGAVPQWFWGLLFFLLLVTFETVGGLRAVVLTDVFQGGVLLFGAVAWLVVQYTTFGGLEAAAEVLERDNPQLLAPPSGTGFGSWFNFMILVGAGRVVFPDILTRFTAAGNQKRVRVTAVVLTICAFVIFPAMGLIGIHGRARYGDDLSPNSVFSKVCLEVVESGWLGAMVGSLLLASSQAAIMSTADSVLMEVGKLMALDICKPIMQAAGKEVTENTTLWVGRLVTTVTGGLCWALTAWELVTIQGLSGLLALQNIFCTALAPMFFVSMYSDICPAWLASLSIAFGLFFGILSWALKSNAETLIGDPEPVLPAVVVVLNFAMVVSVLAALRWRSSVDEMWGYWARAISARDSPLFGDCSRDIAEASRSREEAFVRPALARPDERAPLREPIHQWPVLVAVMCALPLLLPFGGHDAGLRTWGLPDWSLVWMLRMLGLAAVLVYLVVYHWAEAPSNDKGKSETDPESSRNESSQSLAKSPSHANAPTEVV